MRYSEIEAIQIAGFRKLVSLLAKGNEMKMKSAKRLMTVFMLLFIKVAACFLRQEKPMWSRRPVICCYGTQRLLPALDAKLLR